MMKKFLFVLIAIFVTGEMCKAQTLPLNQKLQIGKEALSSTKKQAAKKASASGSMYWATSESQYDSRGQFMTNGKTNTKEYTATLTFDGTDVAIDNLMDVSNYSYYSPTMQTLHGVYDAEAHTITVSTPPYDSEKELSEYTLAGEMNYGGGNVGFYLFTGDFSSEPDETGQYYVSLIDNLVFDVSDDLKTITSRTGFGYYALYEDDGYSLGFVDFYKSSTLNLLTSDANLSISPSEISFTGASVTVGASLSEYFYLTNKSSAETSYTVNVVGDGLSVLAARSIEAAATDTYKVMFNPKKAGSFNGYVTFTAPNGSMAKLTVTAEVGEAPDYSAIVKNGDIAFSYGTDSPFALTDTIVDGKTVAVSTNSGASTSTLNASFTVPDGKKGVISWKGMSLSMQPNGVHIWLDDDEYYNNLYSHAGSLGRDDISNTIIVESGTHRLSFVNDIMMDWHDYGYIDETIRTWVYDFDFELVDNSDNSALLKDPTADFGRHYYDCLSVSDTTTVRLMNTGDNALQVTGVDGSDHFTALVDDTTADFGKDLTVKLVFTADAIDEYDENIVLHTSAGDFTVNCKSSTEKIVYDYTPIVTEGTFSFNTSFDYPMIVDGNTAKSNISDLDPTGVNLKAWLVASFEVPEGKEGVLSWTALNNSLDYYYFMNESILENGTVITLDDKTTAEYAGEEIDCSSSEFSSKPITLSAGRHNICFSFQKISSEVVANDGLTLSDLALHLQDASGVASISAKGEPVSTTIYSLDGKILSQPQHGVNIVRTTYADGTSRIEKQIMK